MGGIVWIASYPKSGNTWTRSFLHNLLRPGEESFDVNDMRNLTAYENAAHWYAPLLPGPIETAKREDVARVRAAAQERLAAAADGLVFVKTHSALVQTEGHRAINPKVTAGAIYVLRNPLDVAVSYAHHLGAGVDRAIGVMNTEDMEMGGGKTQVYEPQGSWRRNVESWTRRAHQGLFVMRYEDMLARPEATFGRLCDFLRLRPTRQALLAAIEKSSFGALQAQEEKAGFAEKPKQAERFFREGRAGAWRGALSPAQVDSVVAYNREQMARFGYLPAAG